MDLRCKLQHMFGGVVTVDGHDVIVDGEGVARNVPARAAEKLLVDRRGWSRLSSGGVPAPASTAAETAPPPPAPTPAVAPAPEPAEVPDDDEDEMDVDAEEEADDVPLI